jgi:hypothetical protein
MARTKAAQKARRTIAAAGEGGHGPQLGQCEGEEGEEGEALASGVTIAHRCKHFGFTIA